jgi:hypothetical protein
MVQLVKHSQIKFWNWKTATLAKNFDRTGFSDPLVNCKIKLKLKKKDPNSMEEAAPRERLEGWIDKSYSIFPYK